MERARDVGLEVGRVYARVHVEAMRRRKALDGAIADCGGVLVVC
jgi:hypothetical protein